MFLFFKKIILSLKILPPKEKAVLFILGTIFIISFFGALFKVNKIYSTETPEYGGEINEGVVGSPRFINPLLAVSDTDRDFVKLIYSGLLEQNGKGDLIPVLAEKYEISENGLVYTFYIKKSAKWHDGKNITSDDVIFTIKRAKNPTLDSFQRANWEGVETEKIDDYTLRFILKKPYAPFLHNTTIPILPKHIWENTLPEEMGLSNFNIEPIGSGPYKVKKVYRNSAGLITSYTLKSNSNFTLGEPFIKYLNILFFSSEEKLVDAFRQGKIDSTGFISYSRIDDALKKNAVVQNLVLPRIFGLFFNSAKNPIFENKEVREALNKAVDKQFIIKEALNGYGAEINSPIPELNRVLQKKTMEKNDLKTDGSTSAILTKKDSSSPPSSELQRTSVVLTKEERYAAAKQILEKNGWKLNPEGIYEKKIDKKTNKLAFSISTSNTPSLIKTAEILKDEFQNIGADVNLKIFEIGDLNQTVIRKRNYDALIFGEVVGEDPDPFSFWHSSQRNDPGLNIAMYTNNSVDKILEEARIQTYKEKRMEKYKTFEKYIKDDYAAIFLYSPYFLYLTPSFLKGFDAEIVAAPQDRFSLINKWHIYTTYVWPIFLH